MNFLYIRIKLNYIYMVYRALYIYMTITCAYVAQLKELIMKVYIYIVICVLKCSTVLIASHRIADAEVSYFNSFTIAYIYSMKVTRTWQRLLDGYHTVFFLPSFNCCAMQCTGMCRFSHNNSGYIFICIVYEEEY